jgi:hypothetical protein
MRGVDMFRKGQAALEFLMTYGWAILVVIAGISALSYFGILDMGSVLPARCSFPAGIDCVGTAVIDADTNTVLFEIQNVYGLPINITTASITSNECGSPILTSCSGDGCSDFSQNSGFENYEHGLIKIVCSNGMDAGRVNLAVKINYKDITNNVSLATKGSIRGNAN